MYFFHAPIFSLDICSRFFLKNRLQIDCWEPILLRKKTTVNKNTKLYVKNSKPSEKLLGSREKKNYYMIQIYSFGPYGWQNHLCVCTHFNF